MELLHSARFPPSRICRVHSCGTRWIRSRMHSSCTITLGGSCGGGPASPPVVGHPRPFPPLEVLNHASASLRASTGVSGTRGSYLICSISESAVYSGRWHRRWCRKIRRWQDERMAEWMMVRRGEEGVYSTLLNPLPTSFNGVVFAGASCRWLRAGRTIRRWLAVRRPDARRHCSSIGQRRGRGAAHRSITSPAIVVPRRWSAGDDAGRTLACFETLALQRVVPQGQRVWQKIDDLNQPC